MIPKTTIYLSLLLVCVSCLEVNNKVEKIVLGQWRGLLLLNSDANIASDILINKMSRDIKLPFDIRSNGELPFIFETKSDPNGKLYIEIINGKEKITLRDVEFIQDSQRERDSIVIRFPLYDTHIEALVERDIMEGYFIKDYAKNYRIPFKAYFSRNFRFTSANKPPKHNITGSWHTQFTEVKTGKTYPAIAEFTQDGNHLEGTFITETGDYRFLEGTVQKDKIYLSTFDGTHAFLFEGKIFDEKKLFGIFRSGPSYTESWEATPLTQSAIKDANDLTKTTSNQPVNFSFPDENNTLVSLSDPRYKNKPVILQIMGTWCPNCKDETNFLLDYKSKNTDKNFEIIGLAFERYENTNKSLETLARYRKEMNISYPILLAGNSTSKEQATKALPFIDKVYSYPTLIFLDKEHKIIKIHTGFSGPATSKYESFKNDFDLTIEQLLAS